MQYWRGDDGVGEENILNNIMKNLATTIMGIAMALASGCATLPPSDLTSIQGTWKGQEVRDGHSTTSWLTFDGQEVEFRPADHREWYKGTFTLRENTYPKQLIVRITDCQEFRKVGQQALEIYQLKPGPEEQGILVITANEPGNPQAPAGFGDRHAHQIVFSRESQ